MDNPDKKDKFQIYLEFTRDLLSNKIRTLDSSLLHALLGVAGESGELVDEYKKCMFYGKLFDKFKMKEEVGDLLFYVQVIINQLGSSMEEIMDMNMAKLNVRYPDGYSDKRAIVRNKVNEITAMKSVEEDHHNGH